MTGIPVIRIELEGMKLAIVTAYTKHMAEIDNDVQAAIKAAVDNFDIRAEVKRIAGDCIREALKRAIEDQFRRHDGAGYQAIEQVATTLAQNAIKKIADDAA